MTPDETVRTAVNLIGNHAARDTLPSGPVLDTAARALSRNSTWTAALRGFLETPGDQDLRANVEFMLQRVASTDPAFLGQLSAAVDSENPPPQPPAQSSSAITVHGSKNKIKDIAGRDVNKNRTIKIGSGALAVLLLAGGGSYTAYKATHTSHSGPPKAVISQSSLPFPESSYTPPPGTLCLLSSQEASALEARTVTVPPKFYVTIKGGVAFCEYLPPNSGLSFTKIGLEISAYANVETLTDNGKFPLTNGERTSPKGQFTAAWVWPVGHSSSRLSGLAAARLPSGAYITLNVLPSGSAKRQDLIEGIGLVMSRFHYDDRLRAIKGKALVPLP